ncbi:MAG TPA: Cys-tRNA(Pro) deacylase [Blastocatellia bacterium]|nr:Cys-tRNA(Pro) deacylase [Blastocatellia bacterium]
MTPAINAARKAGVKFNVHRYRHDPASQSYGLEAADALGVDPARVFKTLVAATDQNRLVAALVPVASQLDLKALASVVGSKKAVMADVAEAERSTGYVAGGISPLGQRKPLATVIDETALGFETVYVSAGRRGLDIELSPSDLVRLCRAQTAPIAR